MEAADNNTIKFGHQKSPGTASSETFNVAKFKRTEGRIIKAPKSVTVLQLGGIEVPAKIIRQGDRWANFLSYIDPFTKRIDIQVDKGEGKFEDATLEVDRRPLYNRAKLTGADFDVLSKTQVDRVLKTAGSAYADSVLSQFRSIDQQNKENRKTARDELRKEPLSSISIARFMISVLLVKSESRPSPRIVFEGLGMNLAGALALSVRS